LVADGASRLKRAEVVATGSAKSCPVPVREIVATVLRHDGVAFAVAHNHPGGDPAPTAADLAATKALRDAARTVGLRFLDHVVVADGTWRSAAFNHPAPDHKYA
jgi:DNA repair protein RadC